MNIEEILKKNEGKTLEFKRDLSSPQPILRTITAFANTAGGIILLGIEDKTRQITGINDPLLIEEKIANLISDNIFPIIVPEIEVISWRNVYLLYLKIFLSPNRPHYIKNKGLINGVYIRVGSTNRLADSTIINELKRSIYSKSFDENPLPEFNSEAINFTVASEQFSSFRQLKIRDLETLKLLIKYQNRLVPTVGGMILFGTQRKQVFPDAWIQCGKFKGNSKQQILDNLEIHEYLTIAVDIAINFIKKHSYQQIEISETRNKEKWNIPFEAVRESVINALVHADKYSRWYKRYIKN